MKRTVVFVISAIIALLALGCAPSNPDPTANQQTSEDLICREVPSDRYELRLIDTSGNEEVESKVLSPSFHLNKYYPSKGEYLIGITTGENIIATANVDLISAIYTPCETTHWIRAYINDDSSIIFEFINK